MKSKTGKMLCALSLVFAQLASSTLQADTEIEPGSKFPLAVQRGDLTAVLAGKTRQEYIAAKNAILFNNKLPDDSSIFRHISDLYLDVSWGEKKYGHKAIEIFTAFRQRNAWGDSGKYVQTDGSEVKLSDSVISGHNHKIFRPLLWVRDLWMQASLNVALGLVSNTNHYVKGGLFPFHLGRGIALGPYYGLSKSFLALYTFLNDQAAPGILFSGDLVKDFVTYDLYYSKFETKSTGLNDTFNHVKANHIGRRETPWRGVGKDNELWAARVKWLALNDDTTGNLVVEPYILYNEASDQNVEIEADAKSMLGSVGVAAEWKYKKLEFGGEVVFNYGHEFLKAIDRNAIGVRRHESTDPISTLGDPAGLTADQDLYLGDNSGDLQEVFTKVALVVQPNPLITVPAPATKENRAIIEANTPTMCENLAARNGATFTGEVIAQGNTNPPTRTRTFINAADRFREQTRVDYRGFAIVLDAAYDFDDFDTKLAIEWGYASGDADPHSDEACTNKKYNGFVGLNENYGGNRVPSVMVLDARKLARPLTTDSETPEALNDNSFSDITYFGLGLKWTPLERDVKKFSLNPNLLFYWKTHAGFKFDIENDVFRTDCKASRFLGTELNIRGNYEVLKDLQLVGRFAIFFPGTFYRDVRGAKLSTQKFKRLDVVDPTGFESQNYGLDRDTAYLLQLGMDYTF